MNDTDWREILSFSQKDLKQADKEKLCESLSWMEADDIELNFTDLKTLFRLAQDILKYKTEQVNNMKGQLESSQKKLTSKSFVYESPSKNTDTLLETIAHQEEVIKVNKEILEQLYTDIAELEGRKKEIGNENIQKDSDSSRDALSEINAMAQLENEITMKNRHIRKLLADTKLLEEENAKLKEKVSILKDKLTEATKLIENFTEQLLVLSNENSNLKDTLGKAEESKLILSMDIETLKKKLSEKRNNAESMCEEIKSKLQHWKNLARTRKSELEKVSNENTKLKEHLNNSMVITSVSSPKNNKEEEIKVQELQNKLSEATNEILRSANLIDMLKSENKQLKSMIEEVPDTGSEIKNESDDGKERIMIVKLKKKVRSLTVALQEAEAMVANREEELMELTSQLQLIQGEKGIKALLEGIKSKKRQLKIKDEGIKSLVQEVNTLNLLTDDLQLENKTLRQIANIPLDEKICTRGILKKYSDMEKEYSRLITQARKMENNIVTIELENHALKSKLSKVLDKLGYRQDEMRDICEGSVSDVEINKEDVLKKADKDDFESTNKIRNKENEETLSNNQNLKIQEIIEENEGLRQGLQDILNFLKDNSTTSSGILSLQCPSLEALLRSMEARHAAGWFAPHMATVLELRAALGGKDALLSALHDARKETFQVMSQLKKESEKSTKLEEKLRDIELHNQKQTIKVDQKASVPDSIKIPEFGSWISDSEQANINLFDKTQIENMITIGNLAYEDQLKKSLNYFHERFKVLFDKMTSASIQAADDLNKWSIQEERYKAQIENLKAQLHSMQEDDVSEVSPGLIEISNTNFLQRKCAFLEESYKYIRTLNENMKSEILQSQKDIMVMTLEFESQIQKLNILVLSLTDKLRSSVPIDLFWRQNQTLNEIFVKHRKNINDVVKYKHYTQEFLNHLNDNKLEILDSYRRDIADNIKGVVINDEKQIKTDESSIKESILQGQVEKLYYEIQCRNKEIENLEALNTKLQETQAEIIDKTLCAITNEEIHLMKETVQKLTEENNLLKEKCQQIDNQLNIAMVQLQDSQQRKISNDMEVNMLRHQILDLQSKSDSNAILARLSGEILVAHLHASESFKKIERLNVALNKEKQSRVELEDMLHTRQKVFDVYTIRYETKFRYMYNVMQVIRQQYQGSIPLTSIENYLNNIEELSRKTHAANEKLVEIEDLQANLMTKHTIFDQILDLNKNKCLDEEDGCPHKLKLIMKEGIYCREVEHLNKKITVLEESRAELIKQCNKLEKTLVLINQGFEKCNLTFILSKNNPNRNDDTHNLEVEDIHSDDEVRKSQTFSLPIPQAVKTTEESVDISKCLEDQNAALLSQNTVKVNKTQEKNKPNHVFTQTNLNGIQKRNSAIQTDDDVVIRELNLKLYDCKIHNEKKSKELLQAMSLAQQRTEEILYLNAQKNNLESAVQSLSESNAQKDRQNDKLNLIIDNLKQQLDDKKNISITEKTKTKEVTHEENKSLVLLIRQFENDKNAIVSEYKELLKNERDEYSKSIKDLNNKLKEMQAELDKRGSETTSSNVEALNEVINKSSIKISDLEDKCFKLQNELDIRKSELITYQSEIDRWKDLASERLIRMEHLNSQLKERHYHEVETYKAENQHWLTQLNETQREHMELRTQLADQKALHIKQLANKDAEIEQLRTAVQNLKSQIINMQTMISVNDPSFDLSAIVEVEETSDVLSQHGSDRLELKFDSTTDLHDMQGDIVRIPTSSTTIWQEPVIERLRREKQMINKQNIILRRQIKALAARERRARLDAQNLKSQVFRISSGGKAASAETTVLHNKIATLQSQLASARRDTQSSIALWDKWKRAQQAAERWQARYEEKFQEVKKLESSLNLAKSAVARLEKEKRVLLTRLSEVKNESLLAIEKQESEAQEKSLQTREYVYMSSSTPPPVSERALLDRVQAQQRRIAALEVAEKGNEFLVSEYEKALAEITSLKGQVLKLESTLLESQIRSPFKSSNDPRPEVEYWKRYCEMLKEENVQLTMRVNTLETTPSTTHHQRVNDLEQTVLTLRGLVSKLQAEQKSSSVQKRVDSRPSSGRSVSERGRSQLESLRIEIANLKRSIMDKDLLLEKSKEMLKIAAEREDELLRENAFLRRQINELTKPKEGFLSA